MKGPFVIFCRNHSGSRMLCEAFRQNGFWMGSCENRSRDAEEFADEKPEIRHLVREAFRYRDLPRAQRQRLQEILRGLAGTIERNCPDPERRAAYGWKRIITTFTVEIFLDAFPEGKAVHLIRDGRDVMLSRAKRKIGHLEDPFNRLVVFGNADVSEYRGKRLTPELVEEYRNEIEMQYWVTAVRFGMRGRVDPERYLEVFYEDLCRRPLDTLATVFAFLDVPFRPSAEAWIAANVFTARIGKWMEHEAALQPAISIGEPLLRELGYSNGGRSA